MSPSDKSRRQRGSGWTLSGWAEHHFAPDRSVLASPLVIASSLTTRTQRIRIGLAVQVLPLTNPQRIAEEAPTVDHICGGDG